MGKKEKIEINCKMMGISRRNPFMMNSMIDNFLQGDCFPMDIRRGDLLNGEIRDNQWKYKIDLTPIPTKPENLTVKFDQKTKMLSITGKSEVTKEFENGRKISSFHVWSQKISVPKNVDYKTVSTKIVDNILTFTGDLMEEEKPIEHKIPIQIME